MELGQLIFDKHAHFDQFFVHRINSLSRCGMGNNKLELLSRQGGDC